MVDIIFKSSNLLVILINDVFGLFWLEDGRLELDVWIFSLLNVFREVGNGGFN